MPPSIVEEEELYRRVFLKKTSKKPRTRVALAYREVGGRYTPWYGILSDFLRSFPEPKENLEERVKCLEEEVSRLKKKQMPPRRPTKADLIYEKFRGQLEEEYFGKIVAIDVDSGAVAGIGNTVLEAYQDARKKSSKNKFSYKRVGFPYVYRL